MLKTKEVLLKQKGKKLSIKILLCCMSYSQINCRGNDDVT